MASAGKVKRGAHAWDIWSGRMWAGVLGRRGGGTFKCVCISGGGDVVGVGVMPGLKGPR